MPVRKFPIPNDQRLYEKHGSSKINSLIAGSRILQVHPNSGKDRVKAYVTSTGISTEKGAGVYYAITILQN
jgi:magnesium-transporting ATPase (P-type)